MTAPDHSEILHQLAEEYTARVRAGELPQLEEHALRFPNLAERIHALFPTLLFLKGMAAAGKRYLRALERLRGLLVDLGVSGATSA